VSTNRCVGGHAFASPSRMVGGWWMGTLGADIPATGQNGPSPFYDDSPDAAKQYRALNVTLPSGCSITWNDDGSCDITVPDTNPYEFVFEAFEDNVSYGQQSIFINAAANVSFEANLATFDFTGQQGDYTVTPINITFEAQTAQFLFSAQSADVVATGFYVSSGGIYGWKVTRKIHLT
jgi:hypothetical protein